MGSLLETPKQGGESEGSLASETTKEEETGPLKVDDGKALDESNIKDNRKISDMIEIFKLESFNKII